MKHVNRKSILGLAIAFAFLLGTLAAPVAALETQLVIEKLNQALPPGANNHTYVYVEPDPLVYTSRSLMHVTEDTDYWRYTYDNTGWARGISSLNEPANTPFNWRSFQGFTNGPLGNPALLPSFLDFTGSDGSELEINTTIESRVFSLVFGQHTPVLVERDSSYFGTLAISGQEFVHLTIDCRQDDVSWTVSVVDPEGRLMGQTGGSEGDIVVIPFNPSIDGTYVVILQAFPTTAINVLFDLLPEAISPQRIGLGEVITGELPTGELIMRDDTGSWVHAELAPTVHTYKFWSPDSLASLTYAYNYPEMFIGLTQPPMIVFTNDAFYYGYSGGSRYSESIGSPTSGVYNYMGDTHYISVIGGDNIAYTLYHQVVDSMPLPVNQEFQVENYFGTTDTRAYLLNIEEDSMMRVNSTAGGGDLVIRSIINYEDGFRSERTWNYAATLDSAASHYCPAGVYMVDIEIDSGVNEWIEFNLGPVTTNTTVDIFRLGGFYVPTSVFQYYNLSLYLGSRDNVTASLSVTVRDTSDGIWLNTLVDLANWWDGSSLITHPAIPNNITYMLPARDYHDGYAVVEVCAYYIANNTQGATNHYEDYPVDITMEWVNRLGDLYNATAFFDVKTTSDAYNFSLPLPGEATEFYALELNTTAGTWYNVSIKSGDASSLIAGLFSKYDGRTHTTSWTDLNDNYVGSWPNMSLQFGAISDMALLQIMLSRNLGADGFLWVEITPLATHQLNFTQISPVAPDFLATLGTIALPAAIGVGVIVVVYVVYVKKFKKE
ncbi:MAG: hypothetical protein ACXADC_13595 [Candidatus Thorarchaeota archaeon]|jgi:hypothetical protein